VEIFASQCAPPVSTTPAANFSNSFTSVVDTGGKFATGVNDTGGKSTTQRCPKEIMVIFLIADFFYLPPVSTTPVVHLELPISPRICEKI
jgi:hypothetical protein